MTKKVESRRTRHIDMCYHNSRDAVRNNEVILEKIGTKQNLADLFTKPLSRAKIDELTESYLR